MSWESTHSTLKTPEYNTVYLSFQLFDSIPLYLMLFMTFLNMIELEAESVVQLAQISSTKCDCCVLKYNISSWMKMT